jgi:hypothetical protein
VSRVNRSATENGGRSENGSRSENNSGSVRPSTSNGESRRSTGTAIEAAVGGWADVLVYLRRLSVIFAAWAAVALAQTPAFDPRECKGR